MISLGLIGNLRANLYTKTIILDIEMLSPTLPVANQKSSERQETAKILLPVLYEKLLCVSFL